MRALPLLAIALFAAGFAHCDSRLSFGVPFADGMVLQRDRTVPVWGTGSTGDSVTVFFGDATSMRTSVDSNGVWRVDLPPMAASSVGRELRVVSASGATADVKDVLVGDVWFCSGQSNAELPLWGENPHFRDIKGGMRARMTHEPLIRFCHQSNWKKSDVPKRTAPKAVVWKKFMPENLLQPPSFSAIAVYFALEVHHAVGIPIGLIGAYWGGSRIEPWTPRCGFESVPSCADLWKTKDASTMWNEMVAPWTPMAMRGFLWYQGCANASDRWSYADKMQALYNGWAKEFENPDLKIYFVQLAPWRYYVAPVQEGQALFASREKNAGMAVACDRGIHDDIHPPDKETIGQRLALLALKHDYGIPDIKADSPTLSSWRIDGDRFVLSFDNVESWYQRHFDWEVDSGFEIAGTDGKFHPAEIMNLRVRKRERYESKGIIDGRELIVRSDAVKEPKALRYLHQAPWYGALHNEADLPMGPFSITEEKK